MLSKSVLFNSQVFVIFSHLPSISYFHPIMIGKDACNDFNLTTFIKTCFLIQPVIYPRNADCALEKNVYSTDKCDI